MTAESFLIAGTHRLTEAGVPSARLDCLILLEDAVGRNRAWLLAHPEYEIGKELLAGLEDKLDRRAKHEPLAYIRGKTEFYGRDFYVDKRVLEPRPESETMLDLLRALPLPAKPLIIDVGTGSGALAVTAKLELPAARVIASDIDGNCLDVARHNAKALSADVGFCQADLLDGVAVGNDPAIILANLPYVPDNFTINDAAMNEPRLAIFGGSDGLDLYRRMFGQLASLPAMPVYILAESLPPQHEVLTEVAATSGYVQMQEQDFIQVFGRR